MTRYIICLAAILPILPACEVYAGEVEKDYESVIDAATVNGSPTVLGYRLAISRGSPALHAPSPVVTTAARTAALLQAAAASRPAFEAHLESEEPAVSSWYLSQPLADRSALYEAAKAHRAWSCGQ